MTVEYVEVRTQVELDKALERPHVIPMWIGNGSFSISVSREVHVKGSPRIVSWGSSSPRIVSWGSSSPRIESWGSSSPRIESRESSSPRATIAAGTAMVYLSRGTKKLKPVIAKGGQFIELPAPDISTPEKWCAYHGVKVSRGVATLFKAVDANWISSHGMKWEPGSKPAAPDWDGGVKECGGGLHFCPSAGHTRDFVSNPVHYVACPVKVSEIVGHPDGQYPSKVKAPRCCAPVYEVDLFGDPVVAAEGTNS